MLLQLIAHSGITSSFVNQSFSSFNKSEDTNCDHVITVTRAKSVEIGHHIFISRHKHTHTQMHLWILSRRCLIIACVFKSSHCFRLHCTQHTTHSTHTHLHTHTCIRVHSLLAVLYRSIRGLTLICVCGSLAVQLERKCKISLRI